MIPQNENHCSKSEPKSTQYYETLSGTITKWNYLRNFKSKQMLDFCLNQNIITYPT